jgi:hypothetical protein
MDAIVSPPPVLWLSDSSTSIEFSRKSQHEERTGKISSVNKYLKGPYRKLKKRGHVAENVSNKE